jgi:hypothetical protein
MRARSAPIGSRPDITRGCDARGRCRVAQGRRRDKDQSYFLHRLTQEQLAPVLFPLGELAKREVRAIARREGIPVWSKKDSTGICFIGERPFRDFLAKYLPRTPGPIETTDGRVWAATMGSLTTRSASGRDSASGGHEGGLALPWFVAAKDAARNALVVVQGHDHPLLYATRSTRRSCTGSRERLRGYDADRRRREDTLPDGRRLVPAGAFGGTCRASSTPRSGRRRQDNIWCSTTGTSASAEASSSRRRESSLGRAEGNRRTGDNVMRCC